MATIGWSSRIAHGLRRSNFSDRFYELLAALDSCGPEGEFPFWNRNCAGLPPNLLDLIARMEVSKQKGFGISPETAPLVIDALRLYARMKTGEPRSHKVEKWDFQGAHVEEIVATATSVMVGHAAFHAAVEQHPGASLTLRQEARLTLKSFE